MSKSILLIGSFSGGNYGDTIVLTSLLKYLKTKGFSNIYIPAADPQKTEEAVGNYGVGLNIIYIDVNMRRNFGYRFFNFNVIRHLKDVDYIAFTAGTIFFRDLLNPRRNFVFSIYIMSWILALFKVKMVGLFVGINEPLSKFQGLRKIVVNSFLNSFSHIITRDHISFENVRSSISNVDVSRSYDIAFYDLLLGHKSEKCSVQLNKKADLLSKVVGFNVCEYLGKQVGKNVEEIELIDFLQKIRQNFNSVVWLHTTKGDEEFVKNLLLKHNSIDLMEGTHIPLYRNIDFEHYYDDIDFFIGMRMHSLIPAIAYKVPCFALNYNDKVKGLFQQLDGEHYVLDFDNLQNIIVSEIVDAGFLIKEEQRIDIISNVGRIKI